MGVVMPTPNGLMLPSEFVDQQLKARGIEGYVDPTTGLFLTSDNEQARELLAARKIHPRKYTPAKRRRPQG
jgi:hypothetical protein